MRRSLLSRAGWLALGSSVGVHAILITLIWLLPSRDKMKTGPLPVDTLAMLSDNLLMPGESAPGKSVEAPDEEQQEHPQPAIFPVTMPSVTEPPPPSPQAVTAASPDAQPASTGASAAPNGTPGRGSDGTGTAVFFQVPIRARTVVFVIDRSTSMGLNGGLSAAKREVIASLERLPESTRFQVILYNREATPLRLGGRTELVAATNEMRRETHRLLASVRAEGSTNHQEALGRALALVPELILFVTDADDLTLEQVRAVTQMNAGHSVIHTIEMNGNRAQRVDSPLQLLGQRNGGSHRKVDPYTSVATN
jgi:hypothetical protein